jgi:hypothetical protein
MKLEKEGLTLLHEALEHMESGFSHLPDVDTQVDMQALRSVLLEAADRLQDNYPYFHPFYAGQMLKPPHPVARLAYMLAMWVNRTIMRWTEAGRVHEWKRRRWRNWRACSVGRRTWGT